MDSSQSTKVWHRVGSNGKRSSSGWTSTLFEENLSRCIWRRPPKDAWASWQFCAIISVRWRRSCWKRCHKEISHRDPRLREPCSNPLDLQEINCVESSTFGSEFVALRTAAELIKGIRYKLKMFGVPIDGPARVMCDNQSIVKNGSFPESVLRKKHCSIAYHVVHENIASGSMLLYWESSEINLADLFTKVLPYDKRTRLISGMLS